MSFTPGQTPPESCHPPPEPASHSPRMAGAATSRRSFSWSWPVRFAAWPVAHADGNQARQQIRGHRQPRALGDVVHVGDDLQAHPRADDAAKKFREGLSRAFQSGRNDARGDNCGLEQAEVVLGEVEHLGQVVDVGAGAQVHAHQPQDRLVDHAQIRLDRRSRRAVAPADGQVDRDVQHARPSGKSMPRKKMSLQALCERSMRTGVFSASTGNVACAARCSISRRMRRG